MWRHNSSFECDDFFRLWLENFICMCTTSSFLWKITCLTIFLSFDFLQNVLTERDHQTLIELFKSKYTLWSFTLLYYAFKIFDDPVIIIIIVIIDPKTERFSIHLINFSFSCLVTFATINFYLLRFKQNIEAKAIIARLYTMIEWKTLHQSRDIRTCHFYLWSIFLWNRSV